MEHSLWQKEAAGSIPGFPPLDGDITTDVLIIGGGLAGLLTAHMLRHAGADIHLIEAGRLMGGTSGSTTGKITALHGAVFDRLVREFGAERAKLYYDANAEAIGEYRALAAGADCDFCERDAFLYSTNDSDRIKREFAAMRRIGIPAEMTDCPALPFGTAAALKLAGGAQFDPIRFAANIAAGLPRGHISEHTALLRLNGCTAITNRGKIHARRIVVATHFPVVNRHGFYYLKMYQHRSYMLALRGAEPVGGMYAAAEDDGLTLRDAGDCLIMGGCGARTGKKCGGWQKLERLAAKFYPNAETAARWATQDCITLDGMPYIGRYSAFSDGLYVATGFGKWGMTGSMVAARLLCDLLTGKKNRYERLFGARTVMRPQLALNIAEAVAGWVRPTAPRCPHLGCALRWNAAEHTWNCTCHGSRFAGDGAVIDSPAVNDADTDGK